LDPISLEVSRGQLDALCGEMQITLINSSYSTIVTELGDTTAALLDASGRLLCQSVGIPVHLGVRVECGRAIAARYPAGLAQPGDLYIMNDPFQGGTHLSDIAVAQPVIVDDELLGYTITMSHHQDIGGSKPGSTPFDSYDLHAEGFRIPLMRLASAHQLDETLLTLMAASSRTPDSLRGDVEGQIAACGTGARRLQEMSARWGASVLRAAADELLDQAERICRKAISELPDGVYEREDFIDNDGFGQDPVRIFVRLEVSGDTLTFDFTGSAPQSRAAINNTPSSVACTVYYVVQTLLRGEGPNNAGCYRPITITCPEGSIVNPVYPAPCGARALVLGRLTSVVLGALAACAPERSMADSDGQACLLAASGLNVDTGRRYVTTMGGPYRGGMGARSSKDGLDVNENTTSNGIFIAIESMEAQLPVRTNYVRLWQDSGGAGAFRGGLGYQMEFEWLRGECLIVVRRDRHNFGPRGIEGGGGAPLCRTLVARADGSTEEYPAKAAISLREGDRLQLWTTGGGGYRPPAQRDAAAVLDDVLDERVSAEKALSAYGVAIVDGAVDEAATAQLRREVTAGSPGPI
jgi:N-methylhydantoinase B